MAVESEFLDWLANRWGDRPGLEVPVGDDAAVLAMGGLGGLVVTVDMLIDGVHFRTGEHTPEQIGRKALAVNLSDLAAMAARPVGAVVALSLPRGTSNNLALAKGIIEGMNPLSLELGCPIIGGDTNVGEGPLTISVTALGVPSPRGSWMRSRARPGDRILVTGTLGGSLAGHHLSFTPRVREALALDERYRIHAAMDISDGLSLDLSRMAKASGVGVLVDVDRVPWASAAIEMASGGGPGPLERALGDGEDFELLLAVGSEEAPRLLADNPLECGLTDIGEFTADTRLMARRANGELGPLPITGYLHN
jgi:thiamine-monophosphate kinase